MTDKEKIFEAAEELFGERSVKDVSLDAIATRAGVPPGAVSKVALSKEELVYQLVSRDVTALVAEAQRLGSGATAEEAMRLISERAFTFIGARALLRSLMTGELMSAMPEWEERLRELRERCVGVARGVVEMGVKKGLLRGDLPLDLVAQLLLEVHLAGYAFHFKPGPDLLLRAEQRRKVALEVLLNGLRPRSS